MVYWPIYTITLFILVLLSVPLMSWLLSNRTWIQSHTPDEYRGRVFGAFETFSALLMLAGMGFASFIGENLGISTTFYISASIYVSSGILAAVLLQNIGMPAEKNQEFASQ